MSEPPTMNATMDGLSAKLAAKAAEQLQRLLAQAAADHAELAAESGKDLIPSLENCQQILNQLGDRLARFPDPGTAT